MKTKILFFSLVLSSASMFVNAQEVLDFTTTGSCASYIQWHSPQSTAAVPYEIQKTNSAIVVDGVKEPAWDQANDMVIANILHETQTGGVLDLSKYPQTDAYAHAEYRALWTENGVYMFIHVMDNHIVYQNPSYQWENDGIEFYFASAVGEGKIQVIIPAMVGLTDPTLYPAAKDFESGSATGSNPNYKVFGYDAANWDASTFNWAIKKTSDGWDLEVYMDKDIVTNGNSTTNYGKDKMFAGDINLDFAGTNQDTSTPPRFVREGSLGLLGNSNQEYAGSNYYGTFKMVDNSTGFGAVNDLQFKAIYNADSKEINIKSNVKVFVSIYNVEGQVMPITYNNETLSVSKLKKGIYIVKAVDLTGNSMGKQKLVIY